MEDTWETHVRHIADTCETHGRPIQNTKFPILSGCVRYNMVLVLGKKQFTHKKFTIKFPKFHNSCDFFLFIRNDL